MIEFVHAVLVPRAKRDEALIIVARGVKQWKLPDHDNIIKYERNEGRSAHLTLESEAGKAIARRLPLTLGSS